MSSQEWYTSLTGWIDTNGGFVNKSMVLREQSSDDRGIVASENIAKGTLLIRLPANLAVSGESFPAEYTILPGDETDTIAKTTSMTTRSASPWLRCVAGLLSTYLKKEREGCHQYTQSLPQAYDTLLHESSWPDDQIDNYLSGTTIGKIASQDRKSNMLRSRFDTVVKPYLISIGLLNGEIDTDEVFRTFQMVCACISTRGFHLKEERGNSPTITDTAQQSQEAYNGPFLLPFIDLLNHTSGCKKCTTLQRQSTGIRHQTSGIKTTKDEDRDGAQATFIMTAERDILKEEEILHSYGDHLTSCQLLQTFGFVEDSLVQRAYSQSFASTNKYVLSNGITPAVLSREDVINACQIIVISNVPRDLEQHIMSTPSLEDEFDVWDLPEKEDVDARNESEVRRQISEDILVNYDDVMSDELITLCCAQFLPSEAYEEIIEEGEEHTDDKGDDEKVAEINITILSKDVLGDYFLGNLIAFAIQVALKKKIEAYVEIELPRIVALESCSSDVKGLTRNGNSPIDIRMEHDCARLKELYMFRNSNDAKEEDPSSIAALSHAIYGLAIRVEEIACLQQLHEECSTLTKSGHVLELKTDDKNAGPSGDDDSDGRRSKKIKL
uniref:SET domain-containing protein n=1 Tax=Chaetoceros debilis TaxID=122233 RepID=A0A7S3PX40_9STRA